MIEDKPLLSEPLPTEPEQSKPSLPVPIIAGAAFGIVLLAGLWWLARRPAAPQKAPPSADSVAYLANIHLTDFHMSQADNMVGSNIVYLDGKVNNEGAKAVRHLRVRLFFYDTLSQLVLREEEDIVRENTAPLAPGETRDFQLRFDRLPASWNYQLPQFQLVSLDFN